MNIPGYEITRIIAKGGVSTVFVAVQRSLGREVALKILQKENDAAHATRFMEEGRLLASLHHRNVITVHDVGVTDHWYYIAMEYLKGGSVEDRIREGMPLNAVMDLMETLVGCLDTLHKQGIIHRDVKPANILFQEDGTPKLTDFGIAKHMSANQDITMDGMALGSPYYLSPEQAAAKPLDGRSDIYSLGIVFYEMLTGQKPYRGESHLETLMAHVTEPVPRLPEEYAPYQDMLDRMLAKRPDDRFTSAAELLGYIRGIRRAGNTAEHPAIQTNKAHAADEPGSSPLPAPAGTLATRATVAALALAGVVAAGAVWLSGDAKTPHRMAQSALLAAESPAAEPSPAPAAAASDAASPSEHSGPADLAEEPESLPPDPSDAPAVEDPTHETPLVANTDAELADGAEPIPEATEGAIEAQTAAAGPAEDDPNTYSGVAAEAIPISDPPTPAFPSPEEQAAATPDQVAQWLDQGRTAMADYRLTTPPGNNAHHYFGQVLAADPDNADARQGIEQVANIYLQLARSKQGEGDYATANIYVDRGLRVRPGHDGLLALSGELDRGKTVAQPASTSDPVSRLFKDIRAFFADVPRKSTQQTVIDH